MASKPIDPFTVKRWSKRHPTRVAFTLRARFQDVIARCAFDRYAIPCVNEQQPVMQSSHASSDTAVTPGQMAVLDHCVAHTERFSSPIVEIGAFRGVATSRMAARTTRHVLAVDPDVGDGGVDEDMAAMKRRTQATPNVTHLRMTSGEASCLPSVKQLFSCSSMPSTITSTRGSTG